MAVPSRSMNSCGESAASSRSKRSTMACSMPAASINASFSCSVVIDCGQLPGSRTQRGCGSKVMSAGCDSVAAAAGTTCRVTSTWPRGTPSKLPTVSATGPMWPVGSPRWTFRGIASSAEHLLRHEGAAERVGMAQRDQATHRIVCADEARSRLGKHPDGATLADHGLLLDVELDPLHVGQYDLGRKQSAAHAFGAVQSRRIQCSVDRQAAVCGADQTPQIAAHTQLPAEVT